jgi:hypothetical protein
MATYQIVPLHIVHALAARCPRSATGNVIPNSGKRALASFTTPCRMSAFGQERTKVGLRPAAVCRLLTRRRHWPAAQRPVPELTPGAFQRASLSRYDALSAYDKS